MRKSFTAALAAPAVLVLALSGCSDQSSSRSSERVAQEREGAPVSAAPSTSPTPSPSPPRSGSGSAATAAASPVAGPAAEVCRTVDTAARNQLIAGALALGDENEEDSVVRADTATTYRNFAAELRLIAPRAHGELRSALTKWAGAGTAVGRYIAENEPRAGYVIDFGPTEKQWDAGRKAAEKVCGHELPDLGQ
ncbi:hypothetical protein ACF1HU_13310 [Streptomyces olivaceus]|uniref:hypothetical protein n=1 Tax=Streptomyces olivaceus TaxID=47716 RepID=UPI001CC97F34|nr:hypothetical protein [Streptomyces olivaceus]MBZ6287734.1 hypothetical protein [Streptomyces olivaceus]